MNNRFKLTAVAKVILIGGLIANVGAFAVAGQNLKTTEQQTLLASNPDKSNQFGESVAINEEQTTMVVGSWRAYGGSGAAYVFKKDAAGKWVEKEILVAETPGYMDHFGEMVAISGDTIVVGAMWDDGVDDYIDTQDSGAAFVFTEQSDGSWKREATLRASNADENDRFGKSVAIDGDTIVIGAKLENSGHSGVMNGINSASSDNTKTHSGAAYIFEKKGGKWEQSAYLKPSYVYKNNQFGRSVAIDNGVVAVGAPYDQSGSKGSYAGAVYLFAKKNGLWAETQQLLGTYTNDNAKTGFFGQDVDISGNTLVVGSHFDDDSAGAAYVFDKVGSKWKQSKRLLASNRDSRDEFGAHVAIDGDVIVVGAVGEDGTSASDMTNGSTGSDYWMPIYYRGAAYTFRRNNGVWVQQDYLKPKKLVSKDQFGQSVAIAGDTVIVGADQHDTRAENDGAVYVFAIKSDNTGHKLKVNINNLSDDENLVINSKGNNVKFSNSGLYTLNSGFEKNDNYAVSIRKQPKNKVCIFANSANTAGTFSNGDITLTINCRAPKVGEIITTKQLQELRADNPAPSDSFGYSVAMSKDGKTAIVGAWRANGTTGAAYIYEQKDKNTWKQTAMLTAPAAEASRFDHFGESVAIDGDTVIVGAMWDDGFENAIEDSGAVYVFMRKNGTWVYQQVLRASNAGANDRFGKSVAIDGDIIAVGAFYEGSVYRGVLQGSPATADDQRLFSGAAYIFEKDGAGKWTQSAYLKALDGDKEHQFGRSVGVSNGMVAVGSPRYGVTSKKGGNYEGAVYIFKKNNNLWAQTNMLTGKNPNGAGRTMFFGKSLAFSDNTLVVGSPFDDDSRGAAYVFDYKNDKWVANKRLVPENVDSRDEFGDSVAISGDVIVVGSRYEDGPSRVVNSDDKGNGKTGSDYWMPIYYRGAAYTFRRNGNTWSEQDYLKPLNLNNKDRFGQSVAIGGQFIIVGADQHSTRGVHDGSAYIFTLPSMQARGNSVKNMFSDSFEN